MDSCDSTGQSMICGGMKNFSAWLEMNFMEGQPDF